MNEKTNVKNVDVGMNALKVLASFLVVVLHVVQTDSNLLHRSIYLLGSFAIPLFFMINGYLLAQKSFEKWYVGGKVKKGIIFLLRWSITVGILMTIVRRDLLTFPKVVVGAFLAKSELYHIWFLFALIIIYVILFLFAKLIKKEKIVDYIDSKIIGSVIIFLSVIFVLSIIMKYTLDVEIRDVIPAPFRIETSLGFFFLGMFLKKNDEKVLQAKKIWILVCVVLVVVSLISIILISSITGIFWASSYYDSIFVIIGCVGFFVSAKKINYSDNIARLINHMAHMSVGIWLFHPFVLKIGDKVISLLNVEKQLWVRIIELFVVIFVSTIITQVFFKIKFLQKYVVV